MFGVDDFAVWFAWYFVTDLAVHPSTLRMAERAQAAVVGAPSPPQTEDPHKLLDWVAEGRSPPPPASTDFPPLPEGEKVTE